MRDRNTCGKVNVKLLIVLIAVVAAVGVSLVIARQVRRQVLLERALTAAQTAFEKQDWPAAAKSFRLYLSRHPNNLDVLRKYAETLTATRPLDGQAISGAISACRRIVELDPQDEVASERLVKLYGVIGNFEELAGVAKSRMEHDPNDRQAPLWLAEAQIQLKKPQEARVTLEAFIQRLETAGGNHIEYVQACALMSTPATDVNSPSAPSEGEGSAQQLAPVDWLNKAVAYAPASAEARAHRARFYRLRTSASDVNEADKPALLALARDDLDAADKLGTDNPRVRHMLAEEWLHLGELDRAEAELQAADELPKDTLKKEFFGETAWTVSRFRLGWDLAMRRGDAAQAAARADETLTLVTSQERMYRSLVLPYAVQAYAAVGRTADGRRYLSEYQDSLQGQPTPAQARAIVVLKALLEAADNRPYAIIDVLQPAVKADPNNPQMLRLLAKAYEDTGQTTRAVETLEEYLHLNPQDEQARRDLARQSARSGDFEKAFDVSRQMESSDPTDPGLTLLRIGAGISRAIGQGKDADVSALKELSAELAVLRQQYPDRVDIRIFQSIIATSLGQPEQAEQELKLAIDECKEPLKAEMQLIRHYIAAKRVKDAIGVCEAACKRHEDAAEPWAALSDLYVMQQDYESARRSLQQGLDIAEDRRVKRSVSTKLAVLELSHGDRSAGIDLLKELANDPQEVQARLLLLGTREIRDDPNATERLISELRKAEGESGLWWRLYQASIWLSGPEAAAKHKDITALLEYCVNADPTWPAPVLLLAEACAQQGDSARAEGIYRQSLLANPSATQVGEQLLGLLTRQGRYADAEKVLRQIQNPRIAADWRIRLAVGEGDFSQAIDDLQLKISNEKDTKDAGARVELARLVYQETKDAAQAMRYLDEAKAIAPASRQLTAVRVSILRAEGKDAEARQVLDDYVADYNNFDAYWMRAVYRAEGGEAELAEQDYRKLTTLDGYAAAGYDLLGGFYVATGKLDQGIAAIEEGLAVHPEDTRLKRRLMRLLLTRAQGQDREKALGLLTELERQQPQDPELLMIRATQILSEPSPTPESLATAREKLESIVKQEPTAVTAHLALIGMAMQQQQYQTACDLAVRALSSNANNPALLLARARAELMLGYPPIAAKLAQQTLQEDPNSAGAVDVFIRAALVGGDRSLLEQARTLTESALRRSPGNEQMVLSRTMVLDALGLAKDAIPELEAYCQTPEGSRSMGALIRLADFHRKAGNTAKAQETIGRAEQLQPNSQIVVHARSLLLLTMKRFDELDQIASTYMAARDQDPGIVRNAATLLISQGSPELRKQGVKLFQHGVSAWPTSVELRRGLASGLYQVGDFDAAVKVYREVLDQYPEDAQVLNDLAWILQERFERYDEALTLANQGLRAKRADAHLLDTKGTILSKMPGRLAEAKNSFEEILTLPNLDPRRQAVTHFQLGRVCVKLNDAVQAKEHLDAALEIDSKTHVLTPQERSEITQLLNGLADATAPPSDTQE